MSRRLCRFWIERRRILVPLLVLLFAASLSGLSGCGGIGIGTKTAVYDAARSPVLETAHIETYNEGTEAKQFVRITLGFDRRILVTHGYMPQLRIAGEAVGRERMTVVVTGEDTNELEVTVQVEKVQGGALTLTLAEPGAETAIGIVAAEDAGADARTQRYAAGNDRTVEALIPSGVALAPGAGAGVTEVTHAFNIRSIAWILLTDGGETVGDSLLQGADTLDGAIALHGHTFLQDDEYDVAAALAEALTNHFGDRYAFTASGKTVEARRLTGATEAITDADLRLSVYEYTLVV